ncbi:MAG: ABC transporter ATP-binding protein [Deltaproteobacteria bacterium]|nr:ABC transporter ATP-binding protein [Deltaproteobacteria bacterium]
MSLSLQEVTKTVGRETHINNVSLSFESGSRNILLGRTLAGKTSLLRLMAGLDRPTFGRIMANGKDVTGKSVRKRSVAMVYQQFINYPSLTVFNNIASPLKLAKIDKSDIDRRVRRTAEMLHLDHFLDRLPSELSGGQQQRVAIARALVKESDLLLLDEPLVNLDYKLREELREELQDIFETRKSIVVYTTTEPTEALMLGGNIVVMDEGRVLQTGPTPRCTITPPQPKWRRSSVTPPSIF